MLIDFTLSIGANLATDLIKYGGTKFLDGTKLGAKIKEKGGVLDNSTNEDLKKILLEAYTKYFTKYRSRQYQVFYDFFSSDELKQRLFNLVFDFQPIDYTGLTNDLKQSMGSDWILFRILEREKLTLDKVVEDFINCYLETEKQTVGVGFLVAVREIRQSEQRILRETTLGLENISDKIINSVVDNFSDRLSNFASLGRDVIENNVLIGNTHDLQLKFQRSCPAPPSLPPYFGGREKQLNLLKNQLVMDEKVALVSLNGMGGIGKTTLARVLANQMYQDKTFQAVLWATVTPTPDAVGILQSWAVSYADGSFSIENIQDRDQIALRVRSLLNNVITEICSPNETPRILVVLDDVWDNGLEAVRLVQRGCPDHSTILIITRSENLAHDLHAKIAYLAQLEPDDAVEMLETYLPHAQTSMLLGLAVALGGHTLALELAARRIEKETGRPGQTFTLVLQRCTEEYKVGIPDGTIFADLKLEQGEKRENNLTTALALSYENLEATDQQRFRMLGVLAYNVPFDQTILASLWQVPANKVDDYADTLRLLSLLQADEVGYHQHPLLRAYARALLHASGEFEEIFYRYAKGIIEFASQFVLTTAENWKSSEKYTSHIHFVGDELVALHNKPERSAELSQLMVAFALFTSRYIHRRVEINKMVWLETGLEASRIIGLRDDEGDLLNNMGLIYALLGNYDSALDYHKQAHEIVKSQDDMEKLALSLNNIGMAYYHLSDFGQAMEYYKQALSLFSRDSLNRAMTFHNLGGLHNAQGDYKKAISYLRKSLKIRGGKDKFEVARTNSLLGDVYESLNQNNLALVCYELALRFYRETGSRLMELDTLMTICSYYLRTNNYFKLAEYIQPGLSLAEALNREDDVNLIKSVLSKIKSLGNLSSLRFLSNENIDKMIHRTVSAKTSKSNNERKFWRKELQRLSDDVKQQGFENESQFAQALLHVIDNKIVLLPKEHPYYEAVERTIILISSKSS